MLPEPLAEQKSVRDERGGAGVRARRRRPADHAAGEVEHAALVGAAAVRLAEADEQRFASDDERRLGQRLPGPRGPRTELLGQAAPVWRVLVLAHAGHQRSRPHSRAVGAEADHRSSGLASAGDDEAVVERQELVDRRAVRERRLDDVLLASKLVEAQERPLGRQPNRPSLVDVQRPVSDVDLARCLQAAAPVEHFEAARALHSGWRWPPHRCDDPICGRGELAREAGERADERVPAEHAGQDTAFPAANGYRRHSRGYVLTTVQSISISPRFQIA